MKRFLTLLLVLALLAGCGAQDGSPEASQGEISLESSEDLQAPQGPPGAPADGEQSQEEPGVPQEPPLAQPDITPQQAAELLQAGEDGLLTISTPEELCAFAVLVNAGEEDAVHARVVLTEDLNLSGMDFIPIGRDGAEFLGEFDGGGHIISGLTILGEQDNTGLFGMIGPGGTVENLHLTGGWVSGGSQVGGIAGSNGGLVFGCSFRGTVEATGQNVGGICGILQGAQAKAGGGKLMQCASNAQVSGHAQVGGLVGEVQGEAGVVDCYALGSVTAVKGQGDEAPHSIGGLAGAVTGYVTRCYASIEVFTQVSSKVVGGLVGLIDAGVVSDCYLNAKPVENWKLVGYSAQDLPYEVTGCTVEEITEQATFSGWDFQQVWDIAGDKNRGLPFLRVIAGG